MMECNYLYRFPENYSAMTTDGKKVDVSNITVDLSLIFQGGIGYRASSTQLLSRTMACIGDNEKIVNLPFCVYGYPHLPEPYNKISINADDTEDSAQVYLRAVDKIGEVAKGSYSQINIPLDIHGHASLAALKLYDGKGRLHFYDSLPNSIINYQERYNGSLIDYLKSFFAKHFNVEEDYEVSHLLCQGDNQSKGCGYYTLYTALLLKEDRFINKIPSSAEKTLLGPSDDKKIRAELVLLTMLSCGLESVEDQAVGSYFLPDSYRRVDQLFHKIGLGPARDLKNQLSTRLSASL